MNANYDSRLVNRLVSVYGMARVYSIINSVNVSPLDCSYRRRVNRALSSHFYNHHA